MTALRCRARQPLTCRVHRPLLEDAVVAAALTALDATWDQVHDFYLCASRSRWTSVAAGDRGRQTNMRLAICPLCGREHPYAPDYVETNKFWTPQRRYHAIRQYARHTREAGSRPNLPVDFDALILFDNAIAFFPEANMTRAELTAWYVCGRKKTHLAEVDAVAHLNRVNEHGDMQVYHCDLGDHYHVGHTPKGAVRAAPRATTLSRKFNSYHRRGKI